MLRSISKLCDRDTEIGLYDYDTELKIYDCHMTIAL